MSNSSGLRLCAILGALLFVLASGALQEARAGERLVVFAAASLKTALDNVADAYTAKTGVDVAISYAASSALVRQIEQGAPADIFISANVDWTEYLLARGVADRGSVVPLLSNRIVLIAPANSLAEATIAPGFELAGLLDGGRLAMANTDAVPAGIYGKAALQALGVWETVRDNIAQAENVRAALALVSTGEAPLGIVYKTDAAADPDVRIIDVFPAETHPQIVYPAALVVGAAHPAAADFLAFLQSIETRQLFQAEGFFVLVPPVAN